MKTFKRLKNVKKAKIHAKVGSASWLDSGEAVEIGTYDELIAKKGKFYELKKLAERE